MADGNPWNPAFQPMVSGCVEEIRDEGVHANTSSITIKGAPAISVRLKMFFEGVERTPAAFHACAIGLCSQQRRCLGQGVCAEECQVFSVKEVVVDRFLRECRGRKDKANE